MKGYRASLWPPLAVLSPGPRLAAARNRPGKKWRKMAVFLGKKRHFSVFGAEASNHKPTDLAALMAANIFGAESKKNVGRAISGEDLVDVTH